MIPESNSAENPNPEARVAFVMWSPFHYYVYNNIVKNLPEAEFVVCDTWFKNIDERGFTHINEAVSFLKEKGAFWRVLLELSDEKVIKRFFSRYEIIVSVWLVPPLDSLSFYDWFSEVQS